MAKCKLKFWIEWGDCGGGCFWMDNEEANRYFGTETPYQYLSNDDLPIPQELADELTELATEYQSSLDWDYPPDPSPWTEEHAVDFKKRIDDLYVRIVKALGNEFEVEYDLSVYYGTEVMKESPIIKSD